MKEIQKLSNKPWRLIGIIDPQGRKSKKCTIVKICPTLRAQIHGNPPCVVYEVQEYGKREG